MSMLLRVAEGRHKSYILHSGTASNSVPAFAESIRTPQQRSLRALDWLNFFMADVTTGIGPFIAIYLTATRHWNAASVGIVVSAQSIASVIAQVPAGWLVDSSRYKKQLILWGALAVSLGCFAIVWSRGFVVKKLWI